MERDLRRLSDRPVFKPLAILLLVPVIALSAGLLAVIIAPPFVAAGVGVTKLSDTLAAAGAGFTHIPRLPERSTIYANDGKTVLAQLYLDNREIVRLTHVSDVMQQAVIDTEDSEFYNHGALDLRGLIRALIADVRSGTPTQGGSTITQQLVKNAVLGTTDRTFARKFQELAIAMQVEQKYTKKEILELYLNDIYLGSGQYGIGTAADFYFHVPASKLTLVQSTLLAGMVRAPEGYNPINHPKRARRRRNFVLDRMAFLGDISQAKADSTKAKPLGIVKHPGTNSLATPPYFVTYLTQQILNNTNGEYDSLGKGYQARQKRLQEGGLKIYTTLDPQWQSYAQEAASAPWAVPVANPGYANKPDTGIVSIDNATGAIRTMLSGRNFQRDKLNLVTSVRQTGSAFKPFTLVAAFRQHVSPNTTFSSRSPFCSPKWTSNDHCVNNSEVGDMGFINLWTAIADSVNVVFAQLALQVGPDAIVSAAHDMGITSNLLAVPSITLGTNSVSPLDMASAYQTFANDGVHCEPFAVTRILNSDGVLYRHKPACNAVLKPDTAHLITAMLHGVVTSGTASSSGANLSPWPVSGKTGTTQDYADAWFIGYTKQVSTSVWVGFPSTDTSMAPYFGTGVFGGSLAAPIWAAYMTHVMHGMPPLSFASPPTPKRANIPNVVGKTQAKAAAALRRAHFVPVVQAIDDAAPKGIVVSQSPSGGFSAELGTSVIIEVSTGKPATKAVPTVTGLTLADAKAALTKRGFAVVIKNTVVTNPVKIGVILAQSPGGGEHAKQGSTVTITVGRKH
ncbi:MAG: penicillin-binding protein [Actinomycetota bacterium]|jgi:penicillin-binding protein 1A|nr:penicillin-binding protein [Actinomycetota bacterium]